MGGERRTGGPRQGRDKPRHLLTARDVAERLNIPLRTVYAWAQQDRLPSVPLGRRVRFDSDEIEEIARRGLP